MWEIWHDLGLITGRCLERQPSRKVALFSHGGSPDVKTACSLHIQNCITLFLEQCGEAAVEAVRDHGANGCGAVTAPVFLHSVEAINIIPIESSVILVFGHGNRCPIGWKYRKMKQQQLCRVVPETV